LAERGTPSSLRRADERHEDPVVQGDEAPPRAGASAHSHGHPPRKAANEVHRTEHLDAEAGRDDGTAERARHVPAHVPGRSVVWSVQARVGGNEQDDIASRLHRAGDPSQRSDVVVEVLQDVDGEDGVHRPGDRGRPADVEREDLDLRPVREAVLERSEANGVDVRHDESIQVAKLGSEIAQSRPDLQDRPSEVRSQQIDEESAVSNRAGHDLQAEGVMRAFAGTARSRRLDAHVPSPRRSNSRTRTSPNQPAGCSTKPSADVRSSNHTS
jgi:hypothetical protein